MRTLDDLAAHLDSLEQRGLRRRLRTVSGSSGRLIELDGQEILNFSSNNYLGLADHLALKQAAITAIHHAGIGSTASRLIVGNHAAHESLEQRLAHFHGRPSALLFNSGYHANLGILQALADQDHVVFSDELNHASIIDGCRLSRAQIVVFPHNDVGALTELMRRSSSARRLVVTDTVFSMDGDKARLAELAQVCEDHGAALVVDEAHALGVLGPQGRGAAAEIGVLPDVQVGTLGKAFGSFGAYVTGTRDLTEVLLNRARSFVFTTALPPSVAAASEAALELIQGREGDQRRAHMVRLIQRFAGGLAELGLLAPGSGQTAIFPIMVGDDRRAMHSCELLLGRAIYAQGIRPPTVPAGTARLRFSLIATHTDDDIDQALEALRDLREQGLIGEQGSR